MPRGVQIERIRTCFGLRVTSNLPQWAQLSPSTLCNTWTLNPQFVLGTDTSLQALAPVSSWGAFLNQGKLPEPKLASIFDWKKNTEIPPHYIAGSSWAVWQLNADSLPYNPASQLFNGRQFRVNFYSSSKEAERLSALITDLFFLCNIINRNSQERGFVVTYKFFFWGTKHRRERRYSFYEAW